MPEIRLANVTKAFGQVTAVRDVNLTIPDRHFVALLGPSGSGKSTTLNLIAGLEELTSGEILLQGRPIHRLPPHKRNMGMVFQNYALYPHMSVRDNIAFGLKMQRLPDADVRARVTEVAELLRIDHLLSRRPRALSGGQQQRVALARALARRPGVFLMDEPLSNLDAKLRTHMRYEIRKLQQEQAVTTVYVTHDQTEAMSMSDLIAVMHEGEVQQFGPPAEIYRQPANLFVAGFVGTAPMNFLTGQLTRDAAETRFAVQGDVPLTIAVPDQLAAALATLSTPDLVLGVRPENLVVERGESAGEIPALVEVVESLGSEDYLDLDLGLGPDAVVKAKIPPDHPFRAGDQIRIGLDWTKVHLFDQATGRRLPLPVRDPGPETIGVP